MLVTIGLIGSAWLFVALVTVNLSHRGCLSVLLLTVRLIYRCCDVWLMWEVTLVTIARYLRWWLDRQADWVLLPRCWCRCVSTSFVVRRRVILQNSWSYRPPHESGQVGNSYISKVLPNSAPDHSLCQMYLECLWLECCFVIIQVSDLLGFKQYVG